LFIFAGDTKNYRGNIDFTEDGLPCSKWSVFTSWLVQRIKIAQKSKSVKLFENLWAMAPHVGAEEDAIIAAANGTLKDMLEKGPRIISLFI